MLKHALFKVDSINRTKCKRSIKTTYSKQCSSVRDNAELLLDLNRFLTLQKPSRLLLRLLLDIRFYSGMNNYMHRGRINKL